MIRYALLGIAAAFLLTAAGATVVTAAFMPNGGQNAHYGHAQAAKPAYVKGMMMKNCLDNQSECSLVVW